MSIWRGSLPPGSSHPPGSSLLSGSSLPSASATTSGSDCNCVLTLEAKKLEIRKLEAETARISAQNETDRLVNEKFKLRMEFIKMMHDNNISESDLARYNQLADKFL